MLDPGTIILLVILALAALGIGVAVRRAQRSELASGRAEKRLPPPQEEEREEEEAEAEAVPEEEEEEAEEEAVAAREKRKETAALKAGLAKTRGGFIAKISALFGGRKTIDAQTMDQLEEVLLTADIGVKTSQKIFNAVKKDLSRDQLLDTDAIWAHIREQSQKILDVGAAPIDSERARPFVILVVGVNGVGKTTTIGKLGAKYANEGKKVLFAAGDTFRAAATEQLEIWGQRTGCPVVRGKEGGDPSSVVFDAVKKGVADGYDVVIADTAGRLHTKTDLMEKLEKVRRVTGKALEGAPHEIFLVVDANTGQNAIAQAQIFTKALTLTGIVLTKLDGTAKGGVILGICDELKLPVRFIGIGEKVDDLREFSVDAFVAALYDRADESAAA